MLGRPPPGLKLPCGGPADKPASSVGNLLNVEPEEWGEETAGFAVPLPPADRVWRHPSELGSFGAAPSMGAMAGSLGAASFTLHHPGRRPAMVAGVVGIVAAVALLALLTGMRLNGEAPGTTAAGRLVPELLVATTTILVVEHNTVVAWLGISTDDDVTVAAVTSNSPAAAAGLQAGDVIVAVDGQPVGSVKEVVRDIRTHKPGDTCILDVVREGKSVQVTATLGRTRTD
jgi:hypothetical protein